VPAVEAISQTVLTCSRLGKADCASESYCTIFPMIQDTEPRLIQIHTRNDLHILSRLEEIQRIRHARNPPRFMIDLSMFVLSRVSPIPVKRGGYVQGYYGSSLQSRKARRTLLSRSPRRYPLRLFLPVGRSAGSKYNDCPCSMRARGDRAHPRSRLGCDMKCGQREELTKSSSACSTEQ
jgi:hypothetical protein